LFRRDKDLRTSVARTQETERRRFLVFDRRKDEDAAAIQGHLLDVPGGVINPVRERLARGLGRGVDVHSLLGGEEAREEPPGVFEIPDRSEMPQSRYEVVNGSIRSLGVAEPGGRFQGRFSAGIHGSFLGSYRELEKSNPG